MFNTNNIYFHVVPHEEFDKLGGKYPTGKYLESDDNKWFRLVIWCNEIRAVEICWFLTDEEREG